MDEMHVCRTCEGLGWLNGTPPPQLQGFFRGMRFEVMCPACSGAGVAMGVHYVPPDHPNDAVCGWTLYESQIPRTDDAEKATCPRCVDVLADRTEEALSG